jgi:hypothetical protein
MALEVSQPVLRALPTHCFRISDRRHRQFLDAFGPSYLNITPLPAKAAAPACLAKSTFFHARLQSNCVVDQRHVCERLREIPALL